jgi:hypothetical protein
VWRTRERSVDFDSDTKVIDEGKRDRKQNSSGFRANSNLFDGTGWLPEKNLHSDMLRTIYRN